MDIAVLGLGEAGRIYAQGLTSRGANVEGYDVAISPQIRGVSIAASAEDAVRHADLVLSLVGASAAASVANNVIPSMPRQSIFVDMNTGSPSAKLAMAGRAQTNSIPFADVAILAPVPRSGIDTPLITSGTGSVRLAELLGTLNVPITSVGGEAGTAAGLKLLRSIFMKGLAGIVFESLSAADKSGATAWMRDQIASELGSSGEALLDRLVDGTKKHALRRQHEMLDVKGYLDVLDSPSWMTAGTIRWLHEIAASSDDK